MLLINLLIQYEPFCSWSSSGTDRELLSVPEDTSKTTGDSAGGAPELGNELLQDTSRVSVPYDSKSCLFTCPF